MKLQINNIEFNFRQAGSDLLSDQENLGIGHLIMPGRMAQRFRKECGWSEGQIPHYGRYETEDAGSDHECYNTDTQIVLMNWLFDKRRKYKIDYYGIDPFWICHDSFHAQNDVYCNEVGYITSWIERERLLQGAERAKELGIGMLADTVLKLQRDWQGRWKHFEDRSSITPLDIEAFYPYLRDDTEREIAEFWAECPEIYQTGYVPTLY